MPVYQNKGTDAFVESLVDRLFTPPSANADHLAITDDGR